MSLVDDMLLENAEDLDRRDLLLMNLASVLSEYSPGAFSLEAITEIRASVDDILREHECENPDA